MKTIEEKMYKGFKIISEKEYNKMKDVCFILPNADEICTDEIDMYFENIITNTTDDMENIIEEASRIEIMKKDYVQISVEWLDDIVCEHIYDKYNMDDYSYIYGRELIKDFVKKFNKKQSYYQSGKTVAYLDLSKEVKEYCEEQEKMAAVNL